MARAIKNSNIQALSLGGNPLSKKNLLSFARLLIKLPIKQLGLSGVKLANAGAKHLFE